MSRIPLILEPEIMKKTFFAAVMTLLLAVPAAAETLERSFSVEPGGRLVVDLETGGSLSISGWERSEVAVTADLLDHDPSRVDLTIEASDDQVTLRTKVRRSRHGGGFSYRFHVRVPVRFDLSLESNGGSLDLEGVEGTFEGETKGGELHLSDIRGRLDLRTMGGEIDLTDAVVDGRITTMGGKLTLLRVEGDLDAKTMGGDVSLKEVSGDVDAETMGGDVSCRGSSRGRGASEGPVRLRTMGGEVTLEEAPEGAELETMGGDILVGSVQRFVRAKTMGGKITIREADGTVDASTMGGDVEVRMVDRGAASSHDVRISSESGSITLVVPESLSMDFDVEIVWTRDQRERPEIISDFPLSVDESATWDFGRRGSYSERRKLITGIGSHRGGENRVVIHTVNGDVRIRKD